MLVTWCAQVFAKGIEEREGRWAEGDKGKLRQTGMASLRRWGRFGKAGRREDMARQ